MGATFLKKGLDAKDDIKCNDDDPDLFLMTPCKERTSRSELDPDISANLSEHDPDLPKKKKNKTRILLSPLSKDLEKKQPPMTSRLNRITTLLLPMPLHAI